MTWTSETPAQTGWYWLRYGNGDPQPVCVGEFNGLVVTVCGSEDARPIERFRGQRGITWCPAVPPAPNGYVR